MFNTLAINTLASHIKFNCHTCMYMDAYNNYCFTLGPSTSVLIFNVSDLPGQFI